MTSDSITFQSDGVVLELSDGSLVRPVLLDGDDEEVLIPNWISLSADQLIYGHDADDRHVRLEFEEIDE